MSRIESLRPEHFYNSHHQTIFEHMLKLHKKGDPITLMSVTTSLHHAKELEKVGGNSRMVSLLNSTFHAVDIDHHCAFVIDAHWRRSVIYFANELIDKAYDRSNDPQEWIKKAERTFKEFKAGVKDTQVEYNTLIEAINRLETEIEDPGLRYFEKLKLAKDYRLSTKTLDELFTHHLQAQEYEPMLSFKELKERYGRDVQKWLLSGFFPEGSFNIIDAAGGVGKTRLAYDFAWHLLIGTPWNGLPVTNLEDRRILIVQADENPQATIGVLGEKLGGHEENPNIKFKTRWRINQIPRITRSLRARL